MPRGARLFSVGQGTPFSVANLTGLAGRWKSTAGTSTTTDGVGLQTWTDQSAGGKNLTQAAAGQRPLYIADGGGGMPSIRFDGTDDWLDNAAVALGSQPYTIAAVVKLTTSSASRTIAMNARGANVAGAITDGSGLASFYASNGTQATGTGTDIGTAAYKSLIFVCQGATSVCYVNGVANSVVAGASSDAWNTSGIRVGADSGGSLRLKGDMRELLVCTGAMSAGVASQLHTSWTSTWAL